MKSKNSRYLLLTVLLIALSGECIGQTAFPPASDQDVLDAANVFMAKMIGFTGSIFGSVNEVQRKDHDRINVLETQQQAQENQLDQLKGSNGTMQGQVNNITDAFTSAFPCVIVGLKVVRIGTAAPYVQFTTPTPTCTAWAAWSNQTQLQARRDAFTNGTTIGSYDPTQKGAFSFAIPSTAPLHGTVQVFTYDAGGVKQNPRQVEF